MQNVTERIASLAPEKRAFLERMLQRKRGEASTPKPLAKRNPEEPIPLSFAQQRLWFLDQLEPNSATYNISAAAILRGTLDVAALERTLNTIVSRHEALRTTISINFAGMPEQIVHAPQPIELPVTDLTGVAAEKRRQEAQRLAHEEARTPFDLAVGPLLRTGLLKLAEDEYVLLWTMHHIISDGWSMNVLVREVAALYDAYVEGKESPLPELPLQFGDYAAWQRDWLQGEVLENQLAYWRRQLDGAPEILELPIDKPRPTVQTFQGTSHEIRFSTTLTKGLRELSQREETTLYMVLLAAFQTLLSRYSGQNDICVGSPIANRNRVETEGVIGFFLNTLVLRTDLSGNPTFLELLQRVRDVALGAFSHQDLPFEKLVEELQVARDTGRQPLFQVMFAMQTEQPSSFALPGLKFEAIESESLTAKFDLNLFLTESPQGLVGVFEYNTDLFEATTIARFATHFERLLQAVAQTPQTRLLDLPLLSEVEERRVIEGLNKHSRAATEVVTVHEQFALQAAKTPDAVALVFDERELTYRELDQQSNRLARYLRKRGVSTDTVVAIKFDRSAEMFVAMLSVLKSGAAYLPLDPGYPAERLAFMYEDAQPRLLLTSRNYDSESGDVVFIDDPAIAECSTEPLKEICPVDALAYVIYTSGSTGRPKGVCVTHRLLKNLMSWHRETTLGGVNTLGFASLSFDMSFYEAFAAWTTGGALVVADEEERHDAGGLARLIGSRQIAKAMLPVLMLQQLAECEADKRAELSCLREVITAGEQLRITRAVRWLFEGELRECELQNHYGPAETHVVTALPLSREVSEWPAHPSIGRPLAGARLYVLDQQLRPAPQGVRGEIYIGGEALGRGYWKRASLTAERFVPDPYGNGERLYRTGDAGRWLANGELEYVGRVDQQVKIRGFRIEPGE
jgi:amino acid adenylation domain-containing protein